MWKMAATFHLVREQTGKSSEMVNFLFFNSSLFPPSILSKSPKMRRPGTSASDMKAIGFPVYPSFLKGMAWRNSGNLGLWSHFKGNVLVLNFKPLCLSP
jgi:hypothetical protein